MDHWHTPLDDRNNLQLPGMSAVSTIKMNAASFLTSRQIGGLRSLFRLKFPLVKQNYVTSEASTTMLTSYWSPCPNWAISQRASNFQSRISITVKNADCLYSVEALSGQFFMGSHLVMGLAGRWAQLVLNTNCALIWWILDCFDMCCVIVQGVITLSNKDNLLYSRGRWYRVQAMWCQTSRARIKYVKWEVAWIPIGISPKCKPKSK